MPISLISTHNFLISLLLLPSSLQNSIFSLSLKLFLIFFRSVSSSMNPPEIPPPTTADKRENQLQGPRPTPLRINKDSHKINKDSQKNKKPPKPPLHHHYQQAAPTNLPPANQPLIIYSVSPKPIYVEASNFMSIVQQLTGRDSDPTAQTSSDVPVSPAARFAAIERTSPRERDRRRPEVGIGVGDLGLDMVDDVGQIESQSQSQIPSILSPSPANLPTIPPGLFSPAPADQALFGFSDLIMSPFMGSGSGFLASPSSLPFSVSPTISPGGEFFNLFDF